MDRGEIPEIGIHDELLEKKGVVPNYFNCRL
jgi:hypothetical protein